MDDAVKASARWWLSVAITIVGASGLTAVGYDAILNFYERTPVPRYAAPATPSEPVRIEADVVGLGADVVPVGLAADGSMELPHFGLAGWYTRGPMPGFAGPAVIAGHVDSHTGPDVFFALRKLKPGDVITVRRANGSALRFTVELVETVPKRALPRARIWNPTERPTLRLITCGGRFDRRVRSYDSNVVVYAALREPAAASTG